MSSTQEAPTRNVLDGNATFAELRARIILLETVLRDIALDAGLMCGCCSAADDPRGVKEWSELQHRIDRVVSLSSTQEAGTLHSDTVEGAKELLRLIDDLDRAFCEHNRAADADKKSTFLQLACAIGRLEGQAAIVRIDFDIHEKVKL